MSMPPWMQARVVFLKQPFLAHGCPQHDHSVQKRKQLSGLCNLMFILHWHELKLQAALKVDIKYTQFLIVEKKKKSKPAVRPFQTAPHWLPQLPPPLPHFSQQSVISPVVSYRLEVVYQNRQGGNWRCCFWKSLWAPICPTVGSNWCVP